MATVILTRHLHAFFPALAGQELRVEAATVADVVQAMERLAPGFAFYICDEAGRLRPHVNLFVDQQRVAKVIPVLRALGDPRRAASLAEEHRAIPAGTTPHRRRQTQSESGHGVRYRPPVAYRKARRRPKRDSSVGDRPWRGG